MNEQREEGLETWILEWFQRKQIGPEHHPVARRLFLRNLDPIQEEDKVNVLLERSSIVDSDFPDLGTYGAWVEHLADASLNRYLKTISEGHGAVYSEEYGYLGNIASASAEAYGKLCDDRLSPPDSLVLADAYQACIFQGKSPVFASRCSESLPAYGYSFPDAFQSATEFEKAYQMMVGKGFSELRARTYAECVVFEELDEQYAEIYASCVEEEIAAGRNPDEAKRFADIHAGIKFDRGEPDEDDPDGWRHDLWYRTQAEAEFRFRPEFGERARFLEIFDRVHQGLPDDPEAGSREWFDNIEAQALQRIAAQDAYIAEHGNLRGFKIEEEALVADPAFYPVSDEEDEEDEYRDKCEEMGWDPMDPESRDHYKELGGDSWDDMDENDRDGWTDNMNKD